MQLVAPPAHHWVVGAGRGSLAHLVAREVPTSAIGMGYIEPAITVCRLERLGAVARVVDSRKACARCVDIGRPDQQETR